MNASTDFLTATSVALQDHLTAVTYLPGSVIVREGDWGRCAYLIERGHVRISVRKHAEERVIAVLGPGDMVGEMATIDQQQRSATATAITEADLMPISREQLDDVLAQADPLLNLMLRAMFSRLRAMQLQMVSPGFADPRPSNVSLTESDEGYASARKEAVDQVRLEQAMRDGLKRREFDVHYQPIVDLHSSRIAGFEALVRWLRPGHGMVMPGDFIDSAEKSGLIVPMGLWVLEQAAHTLDRLERLRPRNGNGEIAPLFMTVNVSARQLRILNDVEALIAVIDRSGVDPSLIKLEITENLLAENPTIALAGLTRFKDAGMQLAIDDFGTGYSSLSYLHRYPLDTVKIDQSFISSMLDCGESLQLVKGILALVQGLGLEGVAEGIEQQDEVVMLKKHGCRYGQGYLFSKAVTVDVAETLIS